MFDIVIDCNRRPIFPGDLLRTFHYIGRRHRKRHYLYHTVVYESGGLFMVPTCYLEPTKAVGGGKCLLDVQLAASAEIISGCGPKPYLSFEDRPKVS